MSARTLDTTGIWDMTEVEWMLDCGEDLDRIAARLHTSPDAIVKAARVSGRPGLLAKVQKGWRRL